MICLIIYGLHYYPYFFRHQILRILWITCQFSVICPLYFQFLQVYPSIILLKNLLRNFILHYGDVTDSISVSSIIKKVKPDEIYNLAAQSHVAVSFEVPEYTANADAIGALRILEAIRYHQFEKKTKFYQAGTSEMFGKVLETPQNEKTPFYPRSPYGVAKVYAHWITVNYREAYNIFACNGILFNHESPVRGETFVTRKITRACLLYTSDAADE